MYEENAVRESLYEDASDFVDLLEFRRICDTTRWVHEQPNLVMDEMSRDEGSDAEELSDDTMSKTRNKDGLREGKKRPRKKKRVRSEQEGNRSIEDEEEKNISNKEDDLMDQVYYREDDVQGQLNEEGV